MKLNPIFRDHMVFAADLPIRVYGEGSEKQISPLPDSPIKMSAKRNLSIPYKAYFSQPRCKNLPIEKRIATAASQ